MTTDAIHRHVSLLITFVFLAACMNEDLVSNSNIAPYAHSPTDRPDILGYHWASYDETDFIGLRVSFEAKEASYCELIIANNMRTQGAEPVFYFVVNFADGGRFFGGASYHPQFAFGNRVISQDSFLVQDNEWYNEIKLIAPNMRGVTTMTFFSNGSVPSPETSDSGFSTALSIQCESELEIHNASLGFEGRILGHSQTNGTYARVSPAGNAVASATIDGQYSLVLNSPISGVYFANMNANLSEFRIDHPQGVLTGETGLAELGTSDTINVEQGAGRYTLTLDRIGGPLENMYFVGYGMNPMDLAVGQLASTAISPSAPPE